MHFGSLGFQLAFDSLKFQQVQTIKKKVGPTSINS